MQKDWNWTVNLSVGSGSSPFQGGMKAPEYPYNAGFMSDTSEAYRSARAGHYSIWIVSPPGYSHSRCFEEVALGLQSAFLELGYRVPVVADPARSSGKVVVLGPHLLSHVEESNWPAEMILFNLEQVSEGSSWMSGDYRDRLRRHTVWDYSARNIQALQDMGISSVTLCPIGYEPSLTRIEPADKQDIDVLFIGSIKQRRREILNSLQAAGIDARWGFDIYGRDRDNFFARAKIILNMHLYEAKVFEIVRVSYLLANRMCVVSETGADPLLENKFRDGVAFAAADELAEICQRLLRNPDARRHLQDEGFRIFSAVPQSHFLRTAIENST